MSEEELEIKIDDIASLMSGLEEISSDDYFTEKLEEDEPDEVVSEKLKKLNVSETTIGQDYSEHSKFIRLCMGVAGIVVMIFIIGQYVALVWLINKFIEHATKNTTVILTSFIASTFGETIIIAKVMANSIFKNDHQNQLAKYKSTSYTEENKVS